MSLSLFRSSIGKKFIVGVTGLMLLAFVLFHMAGNLLVFLGQDWLNDYAKHLHDLSGILWLFRAILLSAFIVHIVVSLNLAAQNRRARPEPYVLKKTVEASYASRHMVWTGVVLLAFVVYHLLHFTFGVTHPSLFHLVDGKGRIDVYTLVVSSYRDPWVSAGYIAAMLALYVHLGHGASSFLQSLGLTSEDTLQKIRVAGHGLAILLFIGNASIPAAAYFGMLRLPAGG